MRVGSKLFEAWCVSAMAMAMLLLGCTHTTLIKVKQPQAAIAINGQQIGTGVVKAEVPNGSGTYELDVKDASNSALHATIAREVYSQPPIRTGLLLGLAGVVVGPIVGALAGFACSTAIGAVYSAMAGDTQSNEWSRILDSMAWTQVVGMLVGAAVGLLGATSAAVAWTMLNLQRGPEAIEVDLERQTLTTRPAVHYTVDAAEEQAKAKAPQSIEQPAEPATVPAPPTTLPIDGDAKN